MSLPKGPRHSRQDGDNHCLRLHILNQHIGQETEAGGSDRAAPNLEKLEERPAIKRWIKQRPAEKPYVAHREQRPQDYKSFLSCVFRCWGLMSSAMAELAKKTNVLCGEKRISWSWRTFLGCCQRAAPPVCHFGSPSFPSLPNNSTIMSKPQHKEPV